MSGFSLEVRAAIVARAAGRCEICGLTGFGAAAHHRRPRQAVSLFVGVTAPLPPS